MKSYLKHRKVNEAYNNPTGGFNSYFISSFSQTHCPFDFQPVHYILKQIHIILNLTSLHVFQNVGLKNKGFFLKQNYSSIIVPLKKKNQYSFIIPNIQLVLVN